MRVSSQRILKANGGLGAKILDDGCCIECETLLSLFSLCTLCATKGGAGYSGVVRILGAQSKNSEEDLNCPSSRLKLFS